MKKWMLFVMILALLIPGLAFGGVYKQGGIKGTMSHASAYQKDSNSDDVLVDALPADSNEQFVVYSIEARGNGANDDLEFWAYIDAAGGGSNYQTLNNPFCGGNTNVFYTGSISFADSTVSYVVMSQGGNVGYAEVSAADGTSMTVVTGNSNFAIGTTAGAAIGQADKSGVTFTAGARVYPMYPAGNMLIGVATLSKDSDSGVYAFPKGSPAMVMIDNSRNSDSGVTLLSVTGGYE